MQLKWLWSVMAVMLMCVAGAGVSADVTLVSNGKSRAVIISDEHVMAEDQKHTPAEKDAELLRRRVRDSVKDLSLYLGKMSGGEFPIITSPSEAGDAKVRIYVGKHAQAKFGPAKPGRAGQGLRVVVKGDEVGLIGESELAVSYAVYELLHQLGCRWYMPSEMGEYVPESRTIKLKEMDQHTSPYTDYRTLWYADEAYKRRNRMGGLLLRAGHALEMYVSKQDLEANPQWVATVDGKPNPKRLKWSAPGLADHIANVIIDRHRKNPQDTWSLSPDDGMGYDNSPEDVALDAGDYDPSFDDISNTDRLIWLCNQIAEKVTKEFPDVRFGLLAYANYTRPPVREKVHPAIVPQLAPITYRRAHPTEDLNVPNNKELLEIMKGWNKAASSMSYYYYGWFLAEPSAPNPFLTKWGKDVPLAFENGCRFWQPETMPNFETTTHALYMSIRLAWDPTQKPQDIYDEINRNLYGHASKEMTAYWEFIDKCWIDTPEYSGAGFAYNRRWTPERMAKARELMNAAMLACQTPMELARVKLADDSLSLFETFMQIRSDFAAGNWQYLTADSDYWISHVGALSRKYADQYAFTKVSWSRHGNVNAGYYNAFYKKTYDDAARITKEAVLLTKPLNEWKYLVDKDNTGEKNGYAKVDFDDSQWKTTDLNMETWSSLGYHAYFGTMWYRQTVPAPAIRAGKKTYLWVGSTDGSVKVFINGKHVPFVDAKGETKDVFNGYAAPASFDITQFVEARKPIHISIEAKRTFFNELGTGGLLVPLAIYREK